MLQQEALAYCLDCPSCHVCFCYSFGSRTLPSLWFSRDCLCTAIVLQVDQFFLWTSCPLSNFSAMNNPNVIITTVVLSLSLLLLLLLWVLNASIMNDDSDIGCKKQQHVNFLSYHYNTGSCLFSYISSSCKLPIVCICQELMKVDWQ